jgi:hypothetical protein
MSGESVEPYANISVVKNLEKWGAVPSQTSADEKPIRSWYMPPSRRPHYTYILPHTQLTVPEPEPKLEDTTVNKMIAGLGGFGMIARDVRTGDFVYDKNTNSCWWVTSTIGRIELTDFFDPKNIKTVTIEYARKNLVIYDPKTLAPLQDQPLIPVEEPSKSKFPTWLIIGGLALVGVLLLAKKK